MRAGPGAAPASAFAPSAERSGWPARKNITRSATETTARPTRLTFNAEQRRRLPRFGRQQKDEHARSSTAIRSSTRSSTIVANAAVALSPPGARAEYGRSSPPAPAGHERRGKPSPSSETRCRNTSRRWGEQILPADGAPSSVQEQAERDASEQVHARPRHLPDLRKSALRRNNASRATRAASDRRAFGRMSSCQEVRAGTQPYYHGPDIRRQGRFRDMQILPLAAVRCRLPPEVDCPSARPLLNRSFDWPRPDRGKVRDVYDRRRHLLIVATDASRPSTTCSARDPGQGQGAHAALGVLVRAHARHRAQPPAEFDGPDLSGTRGRTPSARAADRCSSRTQPLPIECVARGYLSGPGWKEYQAAGSVCGCRCRRALRESDRLPQPIFTPATKAEAARHQHQLEAEAGAHRRSARSSVCAISRWRSTRGAAHAESRGIILADTKFEFGLTPQTARSS